MSARRSDPAVLAVDIGSSGTRAAIVGLDGKISAGPFILPHSFSSPEPLASELDPDKIVRNVLACCRQALKTVPASKLSGASFSVFMHSLMAVDRRGRPLTPLITLGDRRAQPQSRLLEGRLDARAVRRRTGCWIHPVYAPAKALWLKQSLGPRWKQADWVCSLKEYLIERLFGVRECDFSTASSSGLMNLSRQSWDDGVLDALEMSPRILSDLADVEFALPKSRSSELRGLKWIQGSTDGACANLGSGCGSEDRIAVSMGTTAAVRVISKKRPSREPAWTYLAGRDRYLCGAATNAGASVLWWLDGLLGDGSKAVWDRALASTVPGADGLVLMPFPLGERPPYPAGLSARFLGETAGVRPEGLRRAAAESMAYRLRDLLDSVQGAFPRSRELVFSGVVAGSPGFMQMIADVLERPLRIYDGSNASLSGAAALSFQSQGLLGRWKGYAPSYKKAVVRPRVRPRAAYRLGYRRYRAFLEQEIRRRMESPRGKEI